MFCVVLGLIVLVSIGLASYALINKCELVAQQGWHALCVSLAKYDACALVDFFVYILWAIASAKAQSESNMANIQRISLDEIIPHFAELEDPRSTINHHHPLSSVLVIALMAVLAGASGPTAIATWAMMKEELLVKLLDLPNGIPRKDVFRRVLMALKPALFQACFVNWLKTLRDAAAATGVEQPVMAVDGKTARRSHDRKNGLGALHSVSIWASEYGLSLGQVACAEKSNEITAIPELLRLVDIKGAIITIDAMGTQKAIASQIIEGKADYVFAVKGNQETLFQAVMHSINQKWENDFVDVKAGQLEIREQGHGREETRMYIQMAVPSSLPGLSLWKGLKSIGVVISDCVRNGKTTNEVRFYISSLDVNVKQFAHAVRSHWGIENSCHWSLDVTYREDESRIREKHLRENFAWINRLSLSLSLLKQHPSRNSLVMKRQSCGWSDNFLLQVLTGSTL